MIERKKREVTDHFFKAKNGMKAAGYEYINLDGKVFNPFLIFF